MARLDRIAEQLRAPLSLRNTHHAPSTTALNSNFTQPEFEAIVRQAKEHIAAGDIFQVVLSRRTSAQPFDIYRALRRLNPSPYMFFFDFGSVNDAPYHVIGASPEMLVRLEGRTATVRPIAGTRRRGSRLCWQSVIYWVCSAWCVTKHAPRNTHHVLRGG